MMYHNILFLPYLRKHHLKRIWKQMIASHLLWRKVKDDYKCCDDEYGTIYEEPGSEEELLEGSNFAYRLLFRTCDAV